MCLGSDQKTASGAAMPGLREAGLDALAARMPTGVAFSTGLLVAPRAGGDGV